MPASHQRNKIFLLACAQKDLPRARELLAEEADINARGVNGRTALMEAVFRHDVEWAKFLIDNDADVNLRDKHGATVLYSALRSGLEAMVDLLLSAGADVNGAHKNCPILCFERGDQYPMFIEKLIRHGADVNARIYGLGGFADGETPLMWYAYRPEILRILLENGANPNIASNRGATALMHAAVKGYEASIKLLEAAGAKHDYNKDDALLMSAGYGTTQIVDALLEAGANPNVRDRYGETPLMLFCQTHSHEGIYKLVEAGADLNLENHDGETALSFACCDEIKEYLIGKGAR